MSLFLTRGTRKQGINKEDVLQLSASNFSPFLANNCKVFVVSQYDWALGRNRLKISLNQGLLKSESGLT